MLGNFQLNKKRTEVASVKPDRRISEYLKKTKYKLQTACMMYKSGIGKKKRLKAN